MLLEKNPYENHFPININVANITEYPIHYHQDIELVFVLKGEIKLKNGYCNYLLHEGDIFTNNGHEVHALYSTEKENVIATINISNLFFTQYFPELNQSCYRTYSVKKNSPRLDVLRKMLLNILLIYLQRSFNYKHLCIDAVLELIEFLNEFFNLFAFEDQVVVNFNNDNPIINKRISHIINYLYENHATKITLDDLAEMEHLSTFYISHLIRQCTGLSFREFLCFARAEWSEIYLLGTDKKISAIAKDVGFSTTAYYEKYFYKWFGRTPEDHRRIHAPMVKNLYRPGVTAKLPVNKIINMVRLQLSAESSQDNSDASIAYRNLNINVMTDAKIIGVLKPQLEITVTLEDFDTMGYKLFDYLRQLACRTVVISEGGSEKAHAMAALEEKLIKRGYFVLISNMAVLDEPEVFGCDSIAAPIHIFNQYRPRQDRPWRARLRDQGSKSRILKGQHSLLTSNAIPKPSYYAYLALSKMQGDLIAWGRDHFVVKLNDENPAYIILLYNYNGEIDQLCERNATVHEIDQIINNFKDEIHINISMQVPANKYLISKYSLKHQNSVFNLMAKLNFPGHLDIKRTSNIQMLTLPEIDINAENVTNTIDINFALNGVCIELLLVQSIKEEIENE